VTATLHADAKVEVREALATEHDDGLHRLKLESLGLDELNGGACGVRGKRGGSAFGSMRGSRCVDATSGAGVCGRVDLFSPPTRVAKR
jgi:hypothetical protein